MTVNDIKRALIEQKNIGLKGNLYHKTQIDFAITIICWKAQL